MSFCEKSKLINDYYIIIICNVDRNNKKDNYIFVGSNNEQQIRTMANDSDKIDYLLSLKITSKLKEKLIELKKSSDKKENIIYVPDYIWLDDTIYQIKLKILVYLHNQNNEHNQQYLIPQHQQLWIESGGIDHVIDVKYKKKLINVVSNANDENNVFDVDQYSESFTYPPIIKNKTIEIDSDFVNEYGEIKSIITHYKNSNTEILYYVLQLNDINLDELSIIYMYNIYDELDYVKNVEKINIDNKYWNGYFLKYFPSANLNFDNKKIKNIYEDVRKNINFTNNIITDIYLGQHKFKRNINLEGCYIWKILTVANLQNNNYIEFPLDLIYIYLKNKLSDNLPFIYYISPFDKIPYVSIHAPSLKNNKNLKENIKPWMWSSKHDKRKSHDGIIVKLATHTHNKELKYTSVHIQRTGLISINNAFDTDNNISPNDLNNIYSKCNLFISDINNQFLYKQGYVKLPEPNLIFKNTDIYKNEETSIRYMDGKINFKLSEKIDMNKILKI